MRSTHTADVAAANLADPTTRDYGFLGTSYSPASLRVWLLLAGVYWIAAKAGLALAFVNASATAVWPPAGIAFAAVMVFGPRVWPGILLGAFLANATTAGSLVTSLIIGIGNTSEALLGGYLVTRFAGGRSALYHGKQIFLLVLLAGMVSPTISATIGVTTLSLSGLARWSEYAIIWLTWWLGDTTGVIVVAPVLLLWYDSPRLSWTRAQRLELLLLVVSLVTLGWLVFVVTARPVTFLCLPVCIWAGLRFSQRTAATATCLLSIIALWGTLHGHGSFGALPPNEGLLLLQAFMAVSTVTSLSIGAAVSAQRRAENELRQFNEDLEHRVRTRTVELQLAVDKLGTSERRLADAQRVAHIGSWDWNIPENRLWWSDELYQIFGVDADSHAVSYERLVEAVHPGDREKVRHIMRRALADQEPFAYEHRILRPNGEVRILYSQGHVICDRRRQSLRMLGTGQDITERKQLERQFQQVQKMQAVGLLAGGIAHDFNNMLTVILGFTDTILSQIGEDKPISADLIAIRDAAQGSAALTQQLLAFSRKQVFRLHTINLNTVVVTVEQMLRRTLGDDIHIATNLTPRLRSVQADTTALQQVLMNLAINARDAMPLGGTLTIHTANADLPPTSTLAHSGRPQRGVRLTVSDTGEGMDEMTATRIFEPFFTTKVDGKGTGLGLATVYAIVEQLGGTIGVRSTLGHGTTFQLDFPEGEAHLEGSTVTATVAGGTPVGSETIVVAEDDDKVRQFVSTVLQRHGYRVYQAPTPIEALNVADQLATPVQLLLTDMMMPGMNGSELAARFAARHPKARVLFMSGCTGEIMRQHALSCEAHQLLQKPFSAKALLQKVRRILEVTSEAHEVG